MKDNTLIEGHGFSRAVRANALDGLAAEVRF